MTYEDIEPHLNKMATLYLKNNKRKVGWLFPCRESLKHELSKIEVSFVCVQKGKKMLTAFENNDIEILSKSHEKISLEDIVRIRSVK